MAKSLSLSKVFEDAFVRYYRNWPLLTLAGLIVSLPYLVEKHLGGFLSGALDFTKNALAGSEHAPDAWQRLREFVSSMFSGPDLIYRGLISVLVALSLVYLSLGFIRLCIQLYTKGRASLNTLLSSPSDFLSFLGTVAVLFSLTTIFGLGLGMVCVLLKWFKLSYSLIIFFSAVLSIVFFVYLLHFFFVAYCIADKSMGVMAAFSCSKKLTAGKLGKVFGVLVVYLIVNNILGVALMLLVSPLAKMVPVVGLEGLIVSAVLAPIAAMAYTSMYQQLK